MPPHFRLPTTTPAILAVALALATLVPESIGKEPDGEPVVLLEDNVLVNSDFSEGPATPSKAGFDSAETFDVPHWKNAQGGSYGTAARSNGINQRNGKWFAFFRKSCAGAEQLTEHRLGTNETL